MNQATSSYTGTGTMMRTMGILIDHKLVEVLEMLEAEPREPPHWQALIDLHSYVGGGEENYVVDPGVAGNLNLEQLLQMDINKHVG